MTVVPAAIVVVAVAVVLEIGVVVLVVVGDQIHQCEAVVCRKLCQVNTPNQR